MARELLFLSWWESILEAEEVDVCENFEAEGSVLHSPGNKDIPEAHEVLGGENHWEGVVIAKVRAS